MGSYHCPPSHSSGQSPGPRAAEWVGKVCCVLLALAACMDQPPGLLLPKYSFQQKHGIVESFGLDLQSSSGSTSPAMIRDIFHWSGCSRPHPTWFWTLNSCWAALTLLFAEISRADRLSSTKLVQNIFSFLSFSLLSCQAGEMEKELVYGCQCALRLDLTFVLCCNSRQYLSLTVL